MVQALNDAGLLESNGDLHCSLTPEELDRTGVAIGAGMSCTTEISQAGTLVVRI